MYTEDDWNKLLLDEMEWAMAQKRAKGDDEEFRMRVRIVGPGNQLVDTPLIWTSEREKKIAMDALSKTCGMVCAQAAVIVSDMRTLNVPAFCKHFNIAEPTSQNDDQFELDRRRVMKPLRFYMGNLPRHTFDEVLGVVIKGPRICRMALTRYTFAKDKAIVFEPIDLRVDRKASVNMLPAWWN